ncbi:hypothetical protein Tco_0078813 [Tanacetum coccineum]
MGVSKKNQMKQTRDENSMMPLITNLKKNDRRMSHIIGYANMIKSNTIRNKDFFDGGVSGVSLSVVSSSDDKNGEIAGNGGIWSDDGSLDGSDSESDASGGVITGVVSGIVVGILPNKITRPAGVPTLSSDEFEEIEITKIPITCTSKVHINHLYINHA